MDHRKEPKKITRGMYRGVRISVSTLNKAIVIGIVLIVVLLIYGIKTGGYHVTYNSTGGSDVPFQEYKYGDALELPQAPSREGYEFDGWYLDDSYGNPVDLEKPVEGSMTLYAKWIKNP